MPCTDRTGWSFCQKRKQLTTPGFFYRTTVRLDCQCRQILWTFIDLFQLFASKDQSVSVPWWASTERYWKKEEDGNDSLTTSSETSNRWLHEDESMLRSKAFSGGSNMCNPQNNNLVWLRCWRVDVWLLSCFPKTEGISGRKGVQLGAPWQIHKDRTALRAESIEKRQRDR